MSVRRWTDAEKAAADEAIEALRQDIKSMDGLLTDGERASLNADLDEILRRRRWATETEADGPPL